MGDLIWLIIYVIIMVVGFLAKQNKRQKIAPPSQTTGGNQTSPNLQVKFEQYFTQLEKAFSSPQTPPLQAQTPQTASIFFPPVQKSAPQPEEVSASDEVGREDTNTSYELLREETASIQEEWQRSGELFVESKQGTHPAFLFEQRTAYLQGIVMAEVLGPPVSKRRGHQRTM